jgi:hypothetical protein
LSSDGAPEGANLLKLLSSASVMAAVMAVEAALIRQVDLDSSIACMWQEDSP